MKFHAGWWKQWYATYDCWDIHPSGRNDVLGARSNCWVGRDLMQPFDISIEEVPFQYLMIWMIWETNLGRTLLSMKLGGYSWTSFPTCPNVYKIGTMFRHWPRQIGGVLSGRLLTSQTILGSYRCSSGCNVARFCSAGAMLTKVGERCRTVSQTRVIARNVF